MSKSIPYHRHWFHMSSSRLSVKLLEGALLLALTMEDYEGSTTFKVKQQAWNQWKDNNPDLVAQTYKLCDQAYSRAATVL